MMARLGEILPGLMVWLTLLGLIFLSWQWPSGVAIFIIFFDLYWLLKSFYLLLHLYPSFIKLKANLKINWLEKLNCLYCSYINNLLRYGMEIAGRTERYWCPIKYANNLKEHHSQYSKFVDYLDAKNYRGKLGELRDFSDILETEKKIATLPRNKMNRKDVV